MRIERTRQRCVVDCNGWRRTDHEVRIGRLQGRGHEAFEEVTYECLACGASKTNKRYPNLLAGVFSVPKTNK